MREGRAPCSGACRWRLGASSEPASPGGLQQLSELRERHALGDETSTAKRQSVVVSPTTCPASVTVSTKPRPPHSWHGTLTEIVSSAEECCPPCISNESSVGPRGANRPSPRTQENWPRRRSRPPPMRANCRVRPQASGIVGHRASQNDGTPMIALGHLRRHRRQDRTSAPRSLPGLWDSAGRGGSGPTPLPPARHGKAAPCQSRVTTRSFGRIRGSPPATSRADP